jgi:hypothetical protein
MIKKLCRTGVQVWDCPTLFLLKISVYQIRKIYLTSGIFEKKSQSIRTYYVLKEKKSYITIFQQVKIKHFYQNRQKNIFKLLSAMIPMFPPAKADTCTQVFFSTGMLCRFAQTLYP